MNTYGTTFRLTTYGESHGLAVGAIIDGCPAGLHINYQAIQADLQRRSAGAPRHEADNIQWLSGIKDGITLGTPIAFSIENHGARNTDYNNLAHCFRPGHADYTYHAKYGLRDHRGGGRASARETVARVVAGAIAKQLLPGVTITATPSYPTTTPVADTCGGTVACSITGVPAGVGQPLFGKLNAALAAAMLGIPSAIGFEMGAGFAAAQMLGSQYTDQWCPSGGTLTNHCGGIQGGITNGMPIQFTVAFHPVVSIPGPTQCLTESGTIETINLQGRHDTCHVQRTAVIVEAMAALCLANYMLD